MNDYFKTVVPTYIENWPKALMHLSFSSVPTKLSLKEARALGAEIVEWGESFGTRDVMLVEKIKERLVKAFRLVNPAFVRLGSRSPKDSWGGYKTAFKVTSPDEALKLLTDCSERMHDDLQLALREKYEPTIWLRSYCEDLGYEIRCFIKDKKLIAASQYEHKGPVGDLNDHRRTIIASIINYMRMDFLPLLHIPDVIVDLAVRKLDPDSNTHPITMIEINPFFEYTDPCLFDWKIPDDIQAGYFRCIEPVEKKVISDPMVPHFFETQLRID